MAAALVGVAAAQAISLPEVDIAYDIEVEVDPASGRYAGVARVDWTNPGERVVRAIPLHLYLNAFSNGSSSWLQEGNLGRFSGNRNQTWGHTEPISIVQTYETEEAEAAGEALVEGVLADPDMSDADVAEGFAAAAPTEAPLSWSAVQPDDGNEKDRSLIEVVLARPVGPGETARLTIEFEGRLPQPTIARTGCAGDFCFFGQWYPQVAAYETVGVRGRQVEGWAAGQFHGDTEFYNNFADFRVSITAPESYEIAATGARADRSVEAGSATTVYEQKAVTNFAFIVAELDEHVETHQPKGDGGPVEITLVVPPGLDFNAPRAFAAVKGALDVFGERVGPYPYETLTVVYPPINAGAIGGMEYPTLFTGIFWDPVLDHPLLEGIRFFELVDIHEFGHMYFQGIIATNEREDAFMDEGFNSYWELETLDALYGEDASFGTLLGRPIDNTDLTEQQNKDGFAEFREGLAKQPSYVFLAGTNGAQIYNRPAATLRTAEGLFGEDVLDQVFQTYYRRFAFGHPGVEDFLDVVAEVGGVEMRAFMTEAFYAPRSPDYSVERARSNPTTVPPGRYVGADGGVAVVEGAQTASSAALDAWLPAYAREADGRVSAKVQEGGWADGRGISEPGSIGYVRWEPAMLAARTDDHDPNAFYTSYVRVNGPAWRHLPVEVVFTFSDGAVVTDVWDGRDAYRTWEFIRAARLVRVETDPAGKIMIDADPSNDGRVLEPPAAAVEEARGWGAFAAGLIGLVLNGAGGLL